MTSFNGAWMWRRGGDYVTNNSECTGQQSGAVQQLHGELWACQELHNQIEPVKGVYDQQSGLVKRLWQQTVLKKFMTN